MQFVGGAEGDQHSGRAWAGNANDHVAQFASRGIGNAGTHDDLFEAEAFGCRGKPVHDVAKFVAPQSEWRPNVQEDAVPMQALLRSPAGLEKPDAGERLSEHALEVRELHDPPRFIAHRRDIANFRAGEQALIFGILPSDSVQQINIFDSGQPLDIEVAEPPQVEALPHHRVQATIDLFLLISSGARTIGEVLHASDSLAHSWTCDRNYDAADRARKAGFGEGPLHILLRHLGIVRASIVPCVEINHDVMVSRHGCDQGKQRLHGLAQVSITCVRREHVDVLPFIVVFRASVAMAIGGQGAEAGEGSNAVVALRERLEHQFAHFRRGSGEASAQ